ncbi:MAG: hypothetical protein RIS26_919 [Actinomycetota bacterium]
MATKGNSTPSNSEIAAAMRGLKFSNMKLGFIGDETSLNYREQNSTIHAPGWLRASIGLVGVIFFLVTFILFPRSGEPPQEVQDYYWLIMIGWIMLGVLGIYLMVARDKYTQRRWKLFAKANGLEVLETDEEKFPGNLRKDGSVFQAFTIASKPGRHVWFGIVHGWFDPDHKKPVGSGYSAPDFENLLFTRVNSDSFNGPTSHFGPNRPVERYEVPEMTDAAFQALNALASKYAVVLGGGAFVVSHAAEVSMAVSASMEYTDLSMESRWHIMAELISGKMADVVEGLLE